MNKNDLVEFLPWLHNIEVKKVRKMGQRGLTKYQILKYAGIDPSKHNYGKLNECIEMGFLKRVNDNPPEFIPDQENIWNFWKGTPSGQQCKAMMENHAVVLE